MVRLAFNAELNRRMPASYDPRCVPTVVWQRYDAGAATTAESEYQNVSATAVWLKHPERRTCPDGFWHRSHRQCSGDMLQSLARVWRGGARGRLVEALCRMIFDVLAAGNEDHFTYIIMWFAHLVQRPHESPGVALVFRGEEGTGKERWAAQSCG